MVHEEKPFRVVLVDQDGAKLQTTFVESLDAAKQYWRIIGGMSTELAGFEVWLDIIPVYEGNYVTDEC